MHFEQSLSFGLQSMKWLLFSFLLFSRPSYPAVQPYGLPPECMDLLMKGQDLLFQERFDEAEEVTRRGIQLAPSQPLPRVFLDSVLVTRLQEEYDQGQLNDDDIHEFFREADDAVVLAERRDADRPDAYSKFYLGGAYGLRGLGSLALRRIIPSYRDGRKARRYLKDAVSRDPGLFDAYLGMGEFEYQSQHLGHLLQFILGMPGDKARGIAMLKTCAEKGTFASLPAKVFLARILSVDEKQFAAGLPYVRETYQAYPRNQRLARYALAEAKGLGAQSQEGKALVDKVCEQWHGGWKLRRYPPLHLEKVCPKN
jgi:hypothetical protein